MKIKIYAINVFTNKKRELGVIITNNINNALAMFEEDLKFNEDLIYYILK